MTYNIDTLEVKLIATLMGCKEECGLVNHMNDLEKAGKLEETKTIGDMLEVILLDILNDHETDKPLTAINL